MTRGRTRQALLELLLQPRNAARALSRLLPGAAAAGRTLISLDGQWLKLLHVEGGRIGKLGAAPVEGASPEELAKAFAELCRVEGVVPGEVTLAHPPHLSTIRIFSLPATDPKEIRDIVDLQAEKHTPYAKEEILSDFKVLERDRSGYSRVLLVIAHQDVVQRAVRFIERALLPFDKVAAEIEGLIAWCAQARRRTRSQADTVLTADVDASTTTLLVLHRGQPVFQRSLATGAEQLAEDPAGSAAERFLGELQRSIEAQEAEAGAPKVQEVWVTGAVSRLEPLKERLAAGLELPIQLLSPWDGLELAPGAQAARERLPQMSFTGLIGMAGAPTDINLTPQSARLRQAFEARAQSLVLLGCQGIGALILVTVLIIGRAQRQHVYYHKLQAAYHAASDEALAVEEGLRRLEFMKGRLRHRGKLLGVVTELARRAPQGIQWDSLVFTDGETVVLKGTAGELPTVYEFAAALRTAGLFSEVDATRVSKRTGESSGATDFELRCTFPAPGAAAP